MFPETRLPRRRNTSQSPGPRVPLHASGEVRKGPVLWGHGKGSSQKRRGSAKAWALVTPISGSFDVLSKALGWTLLGGVTLGRMGKCFACISPSAKWTEISTSPGGGETQMRTCSGEFLVFVAIYKCESKSGLSVNVCFNSPLLVQKGWAWPCPPPRRHCPDPRASPHIQSPTS